MLWKSGQLGPTGTVSMWVFSVSYPPTGPHDPLYHVVSALLSPVTGTIFGHFGT